MLDISKLRLTQPQVELELWLSLAKKRKSISCCQPLVIEHDLA
jgi:hypothetical protein